jgi:hypothetical protein
MRLIAPQRKGHEAEASAIAPGCKVGEPVASHLNPVIYRSDS